MQGSDAVLNVVTIPPGASVNSPRLVMDGVRGAFFLYGPGGSFIGSWASQAGTDPYGNNYPQGFYGAQGVISGTDFLVYAGAGGLGNLIGSWSSTGGVDQYGNAYPQGFMLQPDQAGTVQNLFNVLDVNGNTLVAIDGQGDFSSVTGNFQTVTIGGADLINDIINPLPLGIINYGFKAIGATAWPSTAISTTEIALFELDQDMIAGRVYRFNMDQTIINAVTGATSAHLYLKYTSDGSTPSTSSAEAAARASRVENTATDASIGPLSCIFTPGSNATYKFLVTGKTGGNGFQFKNDDYIRLTIEDLGLETLANNLTVLGTGGGGAPTKQTYTKTYNATEFASYYGDTATYGSGPYGQRSHNSNMYQGAASGYVNLTGDQYSFARFNYGQIASDLGSGVVNWVKLRLTNQHFWYNGGGNVIVGWSSYTGTFGDPFQPGAGTHMNTDHYHMNEGSTVTHQMSGAFVSAITSGFTSIVLGTSNSYTSRGDLNNYGYFAGAGSTNTCPQLQINYTK